MFSFSLIQAQTHEHTHKTQTKPEMNCLILWNNQDAFPRYQSVLIIKLFHWRKKKQGQDVILWS